MELEAQMANDRPQGKASTVEEFAEWAHEKRYPYNLANLGDKFWDYRWWARKDRLESC